MLLTVFVLSKCSDTDNAMVMKYGSFCSIATFNTSIGIIIRLNTVGIGSIGDIDSICSIDIVTACIIVLCYRSLVLVVSVVFVPTCIQYRLVLLGYSFSF